MKSISTILEDAADWLEEHAHHKGDFCKGTNKYPEACCAAGAIYLMSTGSARPRTNEDGSRKPDEQAAHQAVSAALGEARKVHSLPPGLIFISDWNDRDSTTKDDVVDVLRGAAHRLGRRQL